MASGASQGETLEVVGSAAPGAGAAGRESHVLVDIGDKPK